MTKPLPKQPQYPLKPEAIQGLLPVTEDLTAQGLIIPSSNLCPETQQKGMEIWQGLELSKKSYSLFPNCSKSVTLLSQVPPDSKQHTVVVFCSAF